MLTSARRLVLASILPLVLATLAAAQGGPRLSHGPAWLGGELHLRIEQAAAGAAFELWFSREPGQTLLPYGLLELKRDQMRRVAVGHADGSGSAALVLPLSASTSAAESPLRFQVLIDAPGSPAGRVLTNAVALKLAGPRLYAGFHSAASSGLLVLDPLRDELVATVDFGLATEAGETGTEGRPVFDRSGATGAAMAGRQTLAFFDPHFGALSGSVLLGGPSSRSVFANASGTLVLVLETGSTGTVPGRLAAYEFASRQRVATLALPQANSGLWIVNRDASYAAIGEFDAAGRTLLRFVDLVQFQDLGTVPVGQLGNRRFEDLAWGWGEVWATTSDPLGIGPLNGTLTRVPRPDLSGPPWIGPAGGVPLLSQLLVAPAARSVVVPQFFYSVPFTTLVSFPLEVPGASTTLPNPPFYLRVSQADLDGTRLWFLDRAGDEPPGGSEPGRVRSFDLAGGGWSSLTRSWSFAGPADLAVLRDRFASYLAVANVPVPAPISIAPELVWVSLTDGSERTQTLPEGVSFLAAAPVP